MHVCLYVYTNAGFYLIHPMTFHSTAKTAGYTSRHNTRRSPALMKHVPLIDRALFRYPLTLLCLLAVIVVYRLLIFTYTVEGLLKGHGTQYIRRYKTDRIQNASLRSNTVAEVDKKTVTVGENGVGLVISGEMGKSRHSVGATKWPRRRCPDDLNTFFSDRSEIATEREVEIRVKDLCLAVGRYHKLIINKYTVGIWSG